jgi:chemotaxis protein CheX
MSVDTSLSARAHEENWRPVLELAVEEVFEIMLGCRIKPPATDPPPALKTEFTAMVGLAGSLCGILTFACDQPTAREVAKCMLGPEIADSEDQISDALGEICNMIAGNFKNKLAGNDQRCMLSVPTVIKGEEYSLRALADGEIIDCLLMFQNTPVAVSLQLHT